MSPPLDEVDLVELREAFAALESKDPSACEVYRRRRLLWSGTRPTLREIGEEMDLSRERVRQLEARFELMLRRMTSHDPGYVLSRAARALANRLRSLTRTDALERVAEKLGGDPGAVLGGQHRLRILLELAGPYDVDDDWCVRRALPQETGDLLDRLVAKGPVPLATAAREVAALGVYSEDAEAWISLSKDFMVIEEHLVPRGASLADRGAWVLKVRGAPMTLEEIFEVLDEERSLRSFKGQMQGDPRVMRRGLKHYGLAEWGGEEYTSIIDEMVQEIERRGGQTDLAELAELLSERFGVSPNSVRMYSEAAQFLVDEDGRIAVASSPKSPETKPLPLTRACFRLPSGWAFRRIVDHDVLRGSGSSIPLGFARELGLRPGDSLRYETPYGPVNFSWPSHMAHVGSLRAAAEAHGAREADYLFLVAQSGKRVDILHVPLSDWEKASGIEQLGKRCGCEANTLEEIASALGVESERSDSETATRIRQQLLQRNEAELAELVRDEDDLLGALVAL
jgi:hypothetical protein